MAGFADAMTQQAPQQPQANQPAPTQPQQKEATPEQVEDYKKFVGASIVMLYSKKFMKAADKMLEADPDVSEGMAKIGSTIAFKILSDARKQGSDIDPAAILHGGWAVMQAIKEYASLDGRDVSDEQAEMAFYMAADMLRSSMEGAGMVDRDMLKNEYQQIAESYGEDGIKSAAERIGAARQKAYGAIGGQYAQQQESQQ